METPLPQQATGLAWAPTKKSPPPQAICSGWAWAGIVPPKKGPETSNIAKEPEKEPPLPQQAMALAWAPKLRCAHTMCRKDIPFLCVVSHTLWFILKFLI